MQACFTQVWTKMGFEINVVLENVLNTVLNKNTSNAAVFYQVSHICTCAFTLNVLILDQLFKTELYETNRCIKCVICGDFCSIRF